MKGSLNNILPEPMSEKDEEVLLDDLKQKLTFAANISVRLLRAMEKRFGPEARQVVDEMVADLKPTDRQDAGDPEEDLHQFCTELERACVGTHRWRRVVDEPGCIAYHFTRCMWAEIFRELGEPDLGFIFCAGDEPAVKSCNPALSFRRTKILMRGDDLCDHVFYVDR